MTPPDTETKESEGWLAVVFWLAVLMGLLSIAKGLRPAAPATAGLLVVAIVLWDSKRWYARGLRAFVIPAAIGAGLFTLSAAAFKWIGGNTRPWAELLEWTVISLGIWCEAIVDLEMWKTLLMLALLLILGCAVGAWGAIGRFLKALSIIGVVYVGVVAFCSFSYFGAKPIIKEAHARVQNTRAEWHKMDLQWGSWEELAARAELIGPMLAQAIRTNQQIAVDLEYSVDLSDSRLAAESWARERFSALRVYPNTSAYRAGFIGEKLPGRSGIPSDLGRKYEANPLSPAKEVVAKRLPSRGEFRQARTAVRTVTSMSSAAQARVATQVTMIESAVSSVIGEYNPLKRPVAQALIDALIDSAGEEVPGEKWRDKIEKRLRDFSERVRVQIGKNEGRAKRIATQYRSRLIVSEADAKWFKRLPNRRLIKVGGICGDCGRPIWHP